MFEAKKPLTHSSLKREEIKIGGVYYSSPHYYQDIEDGLSICRGEYGIISIARGKNGLRRLEILCTTPSCGVNRIVYVNTSN